MRGIISTVTCSILLKVMGPVPSKHVVYSTLIQTMVPLSTAVPFVSVFPFCSRSPRYEVEDISSRVKKRDRTEGGNASAHCANRTSECGAAQGSVEDCVGMGEAGTQFRRTTTICSCPIICKVCSRRSDFLQAKDGPAGHLRTELRSISAWRPAQSK